MKVDEAQLYHHVGRRIRQRRIALGITQAQLADSVDLLRTSIANIEAGRQKTPLHVLYRLGAQLGIEVSELLPPASAVVSGAQPVSTSSSLDSGVPRAVAEYPMAAEYLKSVLEEDDGGDTSR